MGKAMWGISVLLVIGFGFPMIKDFYDTLTDPVTGTLVLAGGDDRFITLLSLVVWAVPIIAVILVIRSWTKGSNSGGQQ